MSDWEYDVETSDVETWKQQALGLQQNMFLRLGDREWDEWDKSDETILPQKVGFGLYPLRDNNPDSCKQVVDEQNQVVKVILKNANSDDKINFACIFIFGKIKNDQFFTPLFKVKGKQNQTLFIDSDAHVYKSWREYLNSNRLPPCMYCYPRDGLYQKENNQVLIDYGTSPACNPKSGTCSIDIIPTMVTFGSSFMMNSLFPAPIPEMMEIISSDTELHVWMREIALNICRSRSRATIIHAAATGDIHPGRNITIQPVNVVIFKDFMSMVKNANEDKPTNCDVLHFSKYFFFYSNKILKMETAREIIENTQQKVLNHCCDDLTDSGLVFYSNKILKMETAEIIENTQQKVLNQYCDDLTDQQTDVFIKLLEDGEGESNLDRNAHTIKAINHISDKHAFFESLAIVGSDLENHQVQFSQKEPGLISIDDELHIAPSKLVQISEKDLSVILDIARKAKAAQKDDSDFTMNSVDRRNIEEILKNNNLKMEYQRREAITRLKEAFNTDKIEKIKIGNKHIFKSMTPSELDRLANVMTGTCKNYNPKLLEIVNEFAKMRKCETPRDYCNYVEFVVKYVDDLRSQKEQSYQDALKEAKVNPDFNRRRFEQEYGIEGKRAVHFLNEVLNIFDAKCNEHEENFSALEKQYTSIEKTAIPLNENADPPFASNSAAVYHLFKHEYFNLTKLTAKEYYEIASDLVSKPVNKSSAKLNQQGDKIIITFANPINGAKGVVFESVIDGTQSLATVYYDEKVHNLIRK